MNRVNLKEALDTLKRADSLLIVTHASPDGDAIGSSLGLYHLARALKIPRVAVACTDPAPKMYRWLDGVDNIQLPTQVKGEFTLGVMTDVAQFDRLGDAETLIRRCPTVLLLDHHLEDNPDGTMHFLDTTYAAASEIIFDLYVEAGIALTHAAAECLYVGLVTDTGGFRYANTNAAAHRRAAALVATGIDVAAISNRVFDVITPAKSALLKRVLDRLETLENGRVAYSYLTARDMQETNANGEDIEGLVNYARNLEGVDAGLLFREVENGAKVKVSMRSTDRINSAAVLKPFGGGGHAGAAGATLEMSRTKAMKDVLDAVRVSVLGEGA